MALGLLARRSRRARITAGTALLMTVALSIGTGVLAAPAKSALYIVQLAGAPIAAYAGDIAGLKATKPAPGKKVNVRSAAAKAYRSHLRAERSDALRSADLAGRATIYTYDVAFNGFAMRLTAAEAARMAKADGVVRVTKNKIYTTDTFSTPAFLGLDGAGGAWAQQFGGASHAGEGMIIGVLDTGFWPESPSFAPLSEPRPDAAAIAAKWHGACETGDDPNPANNVTCNNKVIGARWYDEGGLSDSVPDEFLSPRDRNLHGTHTASTAGGNQAHGFVHGFDVGTVSGMAPAARLAIYKIGWQQPDATASGATVDIAAAIDDAVADGVDVINMSFSGSRTLIVDPVELGYMFAANAGVFTAVSAGNTAGASTVAHNSPWLTTTAASTHDRSYVREMTLGNGDTYEGPGTGAAVPSSPLVRSVDVGMAGASAQSVQLCLSDADSGTPGVQPALDPALVAGKIVQCDRGVNARTDKSLAVKNAGGVGMILTNTSANSLNADFHLVPTIHLSHTDRTSILAYIASAGAGATASMTEAERVTVVAPAMAAFSSSGPALAGGGDLLKPDITAPGVDVVAAVSPVGANGTLYDAASGTSMSSPHIAGIAALLKAKHPTWSPMAIKSALMTTAGQVDSAGDPLRDGRSAQCGPAMSSPRRPSTPAWSTTATWSTGSSTAAESTSSSWSSPASVCNSFGSIDPSNLNYATIAIGDLAGQPDGHPYGHERVDGGRRHLQRPGCGTCRDLGGRQPDAPRGAAGPVQVLHGQDHPDLRHPRRVDLRVDHVGREEGQEQPAQPLCAQQHRCSSRCGCGADRGHRLAGPAAPCRCRSSPGIRERSTPSRTGWSLTTSPPMGLDRHEHQLQHHRAGHRPRRGQGHGQCPGRHPPGTVRDLRRGLRRGHRY